MDAMTERKTNVRWTICSLLFFATTVNYMDRQVLSLTWKDFISLEFSWSNTDYGNITAVFALVYALANAFSGRFIDKIGTRKGYLWAIGIWSAGACLHAFCGTAVSLLALNSVTFFIIARIVLAVGESGNFPAAIKVTAEYFPKKDRAFATSIFNAGATVGALVAPLSIPTLARYFKSIGVGNGWEAAFIIIGALGFIWMGFWMWLYRKPEENKRVNSAELAYIMQKDSSEMDVKPTSKKNVSWGSMFRLPQTWGIFLAKLATDGVWWFFLFWTPAYISDVYQLPSDHPTAMILLFVLYAITLLSIYGGKLPSIIMDRTGKNAYEARLRAMFIFALFPLLTLAAQPFGAYSYWFPIIIIGIAGAAHQSWSANLFSVCSDLFPKRMVGTITGINGLAGGISSFTINKFSGQLFDYAGATNMQFMGFEGKPAGYFIIFCICAVAYLVGWICLKILVPKYKPVAE